MLPRCCKVIATCFAPREVRLSAGYPYHRQNIRSAEESLEMLRRVVAADPGDAQLVIVNNQTGFAPGDAWLDSLSGCIVEHRENAGGSFGAYDHAWQRFRGLFDYWLLTEDDIVVTAPYERLIERFDAEPDCGMLALVGHYDREPEHAHGAVGLTSAWVLDTLARANGGHLPHPGGSGWLRRHIEINGEVAFGQALVRAGRRIVPYGDNMRWHPSNGCLPYFEWAQ